MWRCVSVCVLCGNPPTRFGGRRAAEAASPSRGCFLQKMASSPSCFLPGRGCETQGNTLRGASRQPPQAALAPRDEAGRLPRRVFTSRGASRTRSRPAEGRATMGSGSPGAVRQAVSFGCERKVARTSAKRGGVFLFSSYLRACLDTVTAGSRRARPRGCCTSALCVFLTRVSSSLRRTAAMLASSGRGRWRRGRRRGASFSLRERCIFLGSPPPHPPLL